MKTSKLIAALLILMTTFHNANGQDSAIIHKPIFWNTDITLGIKNQGEYGGAMLRLYREKSFVALGICGFNYVPEDLPKDYHGGIFNFLAYDGALNSNILFLAGYGGFIPSADNTFRFLLQADAALGKYEEAVNFKRTDYLVSLFFPVSNYEYRTEEGFTAGLHLLAKAELCSRFVSIGVNLETFVTTQTTAFCAGVSFGFGKLRKRDN